MCAGTKPGKSKRALAAGLAGLVADRVAVVEDLGALVEEADHRLDVQAHRVPGLVGEAGRVGLALLSQSSTEMPTGGSASGSWAEVWSVTMSIGASRRSSSGKTSAALPTTPMDRAAALVAGLDRQLQGVVEVVGLDVEVAGADAAVDAGLVDVDADRDALVHGDREGLGAIHAADAGGEGDGAGQRAV